MSGGWRLLTEPGVPEVWFGQATIRENTPLAQDIYRLCVECPPIARVILPGQFVMLRLPGHYDPLLGRAFALFDVYGDGRNGPQGLEIVYSAVGKMTRLLARLSVGCPLEIWGPLGNGFPPPPRPVLLMVAGGIGYTPFMAVAREAKGVRRYGSPPRSVVPVESAKLLFGVRNAVFVPNDLERFSRDEVDVVTISDDGSTGRQGLASDLLEEELASTDLATVVVYCCGPEPLMKKVAEICESKAVPCYVSLETPMACGLGLCYSCVVPLRDDAAPGAWDYQRVCVEGPVFDARRVIFD